MKFNRLNDDKLQIILSRDDLHERNMKKWDLVPYNPGAQRLFQDILEEAYDQCGFEVGNDTQLMIEAYPMTSESILITITKISGSGMHKGLFDLELDALEDGLLEELLGSDEGAQFTDSICRLATLEDAIVLSQLLAPYYEADSLLYRYQEQYYLVISDLDKLEDNAFGFLAEYGDLLSLSASYLEEHGEKIMARDAVNILASL